MAMAKLNEVENFMINTTAASKYLRVIKSASIEIPFSQIQRLFKILLTIINVHIEYYFLNEIILDLFSIYFDFL